MENLGLLLYIVFELLLILFKVRANVRANALVVEIGYPTVKNTPVDEQVGLVGFDDMNILLETAKAKLVAAVNDNGNKTMIEDAKRDLCLIRDKLALKVRNSEEQAEEASETDNVISIFGHNSKPF